MIKLKNLLTEEVYGNKATVYHRSRYDGVLNIVINNKFKNGLGAYGEGIYTTYQPTKKTDWKAPSPQTGDLEKDNPEGKFNYEQYGKFQYKFMIDLINFFIFDWEVYQEVKPHIAKVEKFTKKKSDQNNFINLQAEYFKIEHRINTPYKKRYTSELASEFGFNGKYTYFTNPLINGIVFFGSQDGNVLVCYNKEMIVPISVTNGDTNETINLQKLLNSDMKLKDEFKTYFKKFIGIKDQAMSNIKKSIHALAKTKWDYDEKTDLFSSLGKDIIITNDFIKNGKLLIKFDRAGTKFDCSKTSLISLEGAPNRCQEFRCVDCTSLKTLEGAPQENVYWFDCSRCTSLESLKGAPNRVQSMFTWSGCTSIKTLEGAPQIMDSDFVCADSNLLESLKGCPQSIGRDFYVHNCSGLKSLYGAPKTIGGNFYLSECPSLISLEHLPEAKKYVVPDHLKYELNRILKERGEIK